MNALRKIHVKNKNFHHAYLLRGESEVILPIVSEFVEDELKIKTDGNPDYWQVHFGMFGIDDGRELKQMQSRKSLSGTRKVFVISAENITREAQNSLLKVFEEPTPDTHFFLIMPRTDILLPTLRSRLFEVKVDNDNKGDAPEVKELVESFLKSKPPERLSLLKKMIEDKEKTKAFSFLNKLEETLRSKYKGKYDKEAVTIFENIIKCRSYLGDRSASVKMILEHLALIVPVI